jgi:sarcosine oxidase subunit gamma
MKRPPRSLRSLPPEGAQSDPSGGRAGTDTDNTGRPVPGRYGALAAGVPSALTLRESAIALAWNVQGDATRPALADAARRLFGVALPLAPNTTARGDAWTALWLGPTSWLVLAAREPQPPLAFTAARDSLNAVDGAVFDVSAARVAWTIARAQAATVLAKCCPLDFHPRAFPPGHCAQSLFGHVNALICRHDGDAFTLLVARSFARDAWHALATAGAQYGYEVLSARPFLL